jgi:hypothetical protein
VKQIAQNAAETLFCQWEKLPKNLSLLCEFHKIAKTTQMAKIRPICRVTLIGRESDSWCRRGVCKEASNQI